MKKYAAVVFDWDGTVMDSTHSIVASIQGACADLGLAVPDSRDAAWVIGLSLESALYRCIPNLTAEQLPLFLDRYRHHFFTLDKQIKLFDGIVDVLQLVRQRDARLAVATGKSRAGLDRVLEQMSLGSMFHATRCADETESKPSPTMLFEILDELQLEPDQILMVGDTTHDIDMAANAGVDSMAVTYGAHDIPTLTASRPTAMVSSVSEMQSWLVSRLPA